MLKHLRESWRELKDGEPGRRFVDHYERRQERHSGQWRRVGLIVLGSVLLVAGVFMLVAPGPGIIGVFIGGGVIAQESRIAARIMDWLEVQARRVTEPATRLWKRASTPVRALLVVMSLLLAGAAAYGMYILVS
jgi:uncharacterized protein (TIGR02611 family)